VSTPRWNRISERALCTGGAIVALLALAAALSTPAGGSNVSAAAIAGMIVVTIEGAPACRVAAAASSRDRERGTHVPTLARTSASVPAPLHRQWWRLDLPPPPAA